MQQPTFKHGRSHRRSWGLRTPPDLKIKLDCSTAAVADTKFEFKILNNRQTI